MGQGTAKKADVIVRLPGHRTFKIWSSGYPTIKSAEQAARKLKKQYPDHVFEAVPQW